MIDMSAYIAARSDQLNAEDLLDGPRTITITKVTAQPDAAEQPVSIHYEGGEGRPFKPCKTVRRIMVAVWGKDASKYVGRSMTLYRDPNVQFGGMQVGGIRVSHMSDIAEKKTIALLVTRGRKAPYSVMPIEQQPSRSATPPTGNGAEDPAEKWANAYIAKLAILGDLPAVEGFEAEKAKKLGELQTARADLHEKVTAALAARKAELAPTGAGTFDDDLTVAESQGSDTDQSVAKVIAELEAAADSAKVEAIIKENERHMPFLDERDQMRLEIAYDQARNRVKVAEPAE